VARHAAGHAPILAPFGQLGRSNRTRRSGRPSDPRRLPAHDLATASSTAAVASSLDRSDCARFDDAVRRRPRSAAAGRTDRDRAVRPRPASVGLLQLNFECDADCLSCRDFFSAPACEPHRSNRSSARAPAATLVPSVVAGADGSAAARRPAIPLSTSAACLQWSARELNLSASNRACGAASCTPSATTTRALGRPCNCRRRCRHLRQRQRPTTSRTTGLGRRRGRPGKRGAGACPEDRVAR